MSPRATTALSSPSYSRDARSEPEFTARTRLLVVVLAIAAAALCILCVRIVGPVTDWLGLVVLTLLSAWSNLPTRQRTARRLQISLLGTLMLAAVPLGLASGIVVMAVAYSIVQLGRLAHVRLMFNIVMSTILGICGALTYVALGGPVVGDGSRLNLLTVANAALGLLAANIVQLVLNAVMVSLVLWASKGVSATDQIRNLILRGSLRFLATGIFSLLIYVAWVIAGAGPLSVLFLLPSLLAARWALGHERVEDLAQVRVVDTLNAAMDSRHPGSAQHAASVARLSEWLSEELDVGAAKSVDLALAGALLRLDMLAVDHPAPGQAPRPSRALTGVNFLDDIVPVLDHRPDNPAAAAAGRIVAVADAYTEARELLGDDPGARLAAYELIKDDSALDPSVLNGLHRVLTRIDPLPAAQAVV